MPSRQKIELAIPCGFVKGFFIRNCINNLTPCSNAFDQSWSIFEIVQRSNQMIFHGIDSVTVGR